MGVLKHGLQIFDQSFPGGGSRAANGSSRNKISGRMAKALARLVRCARLQKGFGQNVRLIG